MRKKRQAKKRPFSVNEDAAVVLLLRALNFPIIDSMPQNEDTDWERARWRGQEEFCNRIVELVQEIKEQKSILTQEKKAGRPITRRQDFMDRYERHSRVFEEMQMQRILHISYRFRTDLSLDVGRVKLNQNLALEGLVELIDQEKLDYLKKCEVCQRWFMANRSDKAFDGPACRQKKYSAKPEYNPRRRDNYAWKKKQKAKKPTGKRKKNYAQES
jgi:hypothetical protein